MAFTGAFHSMEGGYVFGTLAACRGRWERKRNLTGAFCDVVSLVALVFDLR